MNIWIWISKQKSPFADSTQRVHKWSHNSIFYKWLKKFVSLSKMSIFTCVSITYPRFSWHECQSILLPLGCFSAYYSNNLYLRIESTFIWWPRIKRGALGSRLDLLQGDKQARKLMTKEDMEHRRRQPGTEDYGDDLPFIFFGPFQTDQHKSDQHRCGANISLRYWMSISTACSFI